jgi:VIT1/CCC1 family predicted Fe2+/Mn2+ transporter
MVLVALKKAIFGTEKQPLLRNNASYATMTDEEARLGLTDDDTLSQGSGSSGSGNSWVSPRVVSDMIIGLSDGLTVPFALTAGLSSLGDTKLVITGGMAELVAGAISMGLGGYLAAKSENDYYKSECTKERAVLKTESSEGESQIADILAQYNLSPETTASFTKDLQKNPTSMVDFIIRFGKGLEEPAEDREFTSAMTIGLAYFFGGFIPLIPYFFTAHVDDGLMWSVIVMLITLFIFGCTKTVISLGSDVGRGCITWNGIQMTLIGGLAAGAAWGLVKLIE